MNTNKIVCNMCGKEFTQLDIQENRGIHDIFGYGSRYDGDTIDLDLCCECFDKLFAYIRSQCPEDLDPLKQRYERY